MKAKLLKKVRERYSIFRVNKISDRHSDYLKSCYKYYEAPFYYVKDNESCHRSIHVGRTINECKSKMLEMIVKDYGFDYKKRLDETKVYYNSIKND